MLALSPISALLGLLLGFALSAALIALLRDKLPQDHGRAFAVNGQVSKGKARGSGVVFIPVFAAVTLLVAPFSWERCAYLFLTLAAMLTGYLDDRSDLPWGELKKGLLDLLICLLTLFSAGGWRCPGGCSRPSPCSYCGLSSTAATAPTGWTAISAPCP